MSHAYLWAAVGEFHGDAVRLVQPLQQGFHLLYRHGYGQFLSDRFLILPLWTGDRQRQQAVLQRTRFLHKLRVLWRSIDLK